MKDPHPLPWLTPILRQPPLDGTAIVAIGRIYAKSDLSGEFESFTALIKWAHGGLFEGWIDCDCGLPLGMPTVNTIDILYWMMPPMQPIASA